MNKMKRLVLCALFLMCISSPSLLVAVNAMQKEKNEPGELRAEILAGPTQDNHYPLEDFLANDAELYRHVEVEFHDKMKGAIMKVIIRETDQVRNKVDLTRFKTRIDLKVLFDQHGFVRDLSEQEITDKQIAKKQKRRLKQQEDNDKILVGLKKKKELLEQEIIKLKSYGAAPEKILPKKEQLLVIEQKIKRVMMEEL